MGIISCIMLSNFIDVYELTAMSFLNLMAMEGSVNHWNFTRRSLKGRDFAENGRKMGSKRIRQALLAAASPGRIQSASLYKNASLHVESRKHD